MLLDYKRGQGSIVLRFKLIDSSLWPMQGKTGLTEASAGLIIATIADNESATTRYRASSSEIETISTLGTFAAPSSSKCRFKEVDATNHPGIYEVQLADARFAVSSAKSLLISISGASGLAQCDGLVPLRDLDPYDAVRAGLSALPNAAAEASGGLPTLSAAQASNGTIQANVHRWLTGTPNALQSGRVDSYIGALADDVITAAKLASDVATEIATGVWAAGTRTLTSFGALAQDVWDKATSALVTAGSIGKLLVDNVNATISSRSSHTAADVWAVATRLLTAGTNIVLAKGVGVTGFNDLSAAQVNAEADTALADYDGPTRTEATADKDEILAAIPTAGDVADQVWEEQIGDHDGTAGSTAEQLSAAGSAGDPWATALPGAYSSGQAGKIVGDNLNATVSSRASQTSVDDLPTNAELATALAAADDAVLAAIAALNNLSQANIRTAIGLASANLDTQLADLPTNSELTAALAAADDAVLAAIAALNNLSQAQVRSAVGLASANLDTQLADLPTNAELSMALAAADDAVLAAIAALNNLSAAQVTGAVPTAIENADALLKRDFSAVTGEATRSVLNALRFLRNKWAISGGTLSVKKEDDTTEAWAGAVTQTAGDPVSEIDPA